MPSVKESAKPFESIDTSSPVDAPDLIPDPSLFGWSLPSNILATSVQPVDWSSAPEKLGS